MVSATMTSGAGARTCIGKNISLFEMYKVGRYQVYCLFLFIRIALFLFFGWLTSV